jgi:hypothetical protein
MRHAVRHVCSSPLQGTMARLHIIHQRNGPSCGRPSDRAGSVFTTNAVLAYISHHGVNNKMALEEYVAFSRSRTSQIKNVLIKISMAFKAKFWIKDRCISGYI